MNLTSHSLSRRHDRLVVGYPKSLTFQALLGLLGLTIRVKSIYWLSNLGSSLLIVLYMKLAVDEITESPQNIRFSEKIEELNQLFTRSKISDFRFPSQLDIRLTYYRSGRGLFFKGSIGGAVKGTCSRCLEYYSFTLEKNFDFILTPDPLVGKSRELKSDEMRLSTYSTDEVHLSPFIKEQVLLALPTRPLCNDNCQGLCSGCGANRNRKSCLCDSPPGDPRMAVFRNLRVGR